MSGAGTLRGPGRLGPLAVVVLLPTLAACASDDPPPTAGEPLPDGVDTAVRGMRTFVTRDGIRRAVVEADTAEWHEENQIHLRSMALTFFDPSGLESTEVTAAFGIFHELSGDLEAEGSVVMEDRRDDQRLETERVRYQNFDGRLYGDTAFLLMRGLEGLSLEGTGFESDPTLDSVIVLNQTGEMRPRVVYSGAAAAFADSAEAAGDSTAVVAGTTTGEGLTEPGAEAAAADDPAPADSTVVGDPAPADSTVVDVDPDALPALDSAAADTLTAPLDSLPNLPDSVPVLSDSVPAAGDSAAAAPDTSAAAPDTTAVGRG